MTAEKRPVRPEVAALKVGDTVKVHIGGTVFDAPIAKIGRVWLTVAGRYGREVRMRLDTQNEDTGYSLQHYFWTHEQWAQRERETGAAIYLGEHGITLAHESEWATPEGRIKLADIIRAAMDEEATR